MKRVVAENLYLKIECSLRQAAEIKQSFGFSRFTPFYYGGSPCYLYGFGSRKDLSLIHI